jgi:hypothetical protein
VLQDTTAYYGPGQGDALLNYHLVVSNPAGKQFYSDTYQSETTPPCTLVMGVILDGLLGRH